MLTTKAFANLCATTKKTVIYYDRIGLLKPSTRDRRGFRTYLPKQVLVFQKIQMLKSFGFPLNEIKKYLGQNNLLLKLFIDRKSTLESKRKTLQKRINKLEEYISALNRKKDLVIPIIKTIKPYAIYSIDKVGRYVDIHAYQTEVFQKIGEKKVAKSVGLTMFYEKEYAPHRATMTTGTIVKGAPKPIKGLNIKQIPGYKTVSYMHIGPYSYLSYIWQFMDRFVAEHKIKRHPQLPACIEFYFHGPLGRYQEDDYVTELQIPILSSTKL